MHEYARVAAYPQGHTVNEAYSGTFAKQHLLDEDRHLPLQFHKPVIGNRMGKQGVKKLAEIICQTKYFYNFVLDDHSENCLYPFVIQYYKVTTILVNHQIFKQL